MIMRLVKTIADADRVYFLTEYIRGAEFFEVLRTLGLLNEDDARFYAACLLLVLEYLQGKHIVYRDLKPENVIIDHTGYPKLIDFGMAKVVPWKTYTMLGTPHYMAPEVILGTGHGLEADCWSLGVMIYEMICGKVPFGSEATNSFEVYEAIVAAQLGFPGFTESMTTVKLLIKKLLNPSPVFRGSAKALKGHPWFASLQWDRVYQKRVRPPHKPHCPKPRAKEFDLINMLEGEEDAVELESSQVHHPPSNWAECF